jgi:hypothetical protein
LIARYESNGKPMKREVTPQNRAEKGELMGASYHNYAVNAVLGLSCA